MKKIKCNNCDWIGTEDELKAYSEGAEWREICPKCGLNSEGKLMDIE